MVISIKLKILIQIYIYSYYYIPTTNIICIIWIMKNWKDNITKDGKIKITVIRKTSV